MGWLCVIWALYVLISWMLWLLRENKNRSLIRVFSWICIFFISFILPQKAWPIEIRMEYIDNLREYMLGMILIINLKLMEISQPNASFYDRHQITNSFQAVISVIIPAQIFFDPKHNVLRKNGHSVAIWKLIEILIGFACSMIIIKTVKYYELFDAEVHGDTVFWYQRIAYFFSLNCLCQAFNSIPALFALCLPSTVYIEYPYCWPLFTSFSPRQFWKNWSKPIGYSLKYVVYIPLGGNKNPMFSISAVFVFNGMAHLWLSWMAFGDMGFYGWLCAFAVLGWSVYIQVATEQYIPTKWRTSFIWKLFLWILQWVSAIIAISFMYDNALRFNWGALYYLHDAICPPIEKNIVYFLFRSIS